MVESVNIYHVSVYPVLMYACVRCFGLYSLSYGIVVLNITIMFGCIEGLRVKALCSIIIVLSCVAACLVSL